MTFETPLIIYDQFKWGKFIPLPLKSMCLFAPLVWRKLNLSVAGILDAFEYDELSITQRRVKVQDVVDYGSHLLGQHTVRLSPIRSVPFIQLLILITHSFPIAPQN